MSNMDTSHHDPVHAHAHAHGHEQAHHGVHHEHHGAVDHAQINREYFDKISESYDDAPHAKRICARIGAEFLKLYPFDSESTTVLDFACGTGLISHEIVPYAKKVIGVDISQGVVDVYNKRFAEQNIARDSVHAVRTDLTGVEGELDGQKFDVITCSAAYHHFESPETITRILAFFLKAGGVLLISDRTTTDNFHVAPHGDVPVPKEIIPHSGGFSGNDVRAIFEGAGLRDVTYKDALREPMGDAIMELFVAKGVKAV